MCAINGVTANDRELVLRMNEETKHRGPDGTSVWEAEGVTLGHNRLAIIDLSSAALQPMVSVTGRYSIVFNGEIYNYRELRKELESSHAFVTESDTEVLLAAYEKWGENVFSRLRGIFAFGIWDARVRTLTLARDHMGVKPLYYSFDRGVLRFSSELSGMLAGRGGHINQAALSLYLELQYVPSDETLVSGVKKLRPGHLLRYREGTIVEEPYYDPIIGIGVPPPSAITMVNTTDALKAVIGNAVSRQLVSDRPVGMFLSGGLDSSIVLHHMAKAQSDVRTFSTAFEMVEGAEGEGQKFNTDAALAERTAQHYGATHTTFTLTIDDVRTNLEAALAALDEPVSNPTGVSQYLLSKWVRDAGVVVALGGDGGDELFGGYTRHRMAMAAYWYQCLPGMVRSTLDRTHPRVAKLNTPFGAPLHSMLMADKSALKHPIQSVGSTYGAASEFFARAYARAPRTLHPVDAFMRVDRETWLPDESLARSDRSSMAHGLELRVPLLDLDVVTYADTMSVYKKTTPWRGKNVLRKAYRSELPQHIFNQPKRGWISPGAKWLRDPVIKKFAEEVLSPQYYDGLSSIIDWGMLEKLYFDHVEKRGYYVHPLWDVLVLQIWAKKFNITAV